MEPMNIVRGILLPPQATVCNLQFVSSVLKTTDIRVQGPAVMTASA